MSGRIKTFLRYAWIMWGLFLMANGIVLLVQARLGVSPWDVLHLGLATRLGLSFGRVLQGVGLLVVAFSFLLGVKPRLVTLLNMFFVGYFVDKVNAWGYIPQPNTFWLRVLFYLFGVAICGFGTALYISGNRGAGPRDSLMLALTRATGRRIGVIRTFMEVSVAAAGYFLGGPLGIGTVLFALLMGWSVEMGFAVIALFKSSGFYSAIWSDAHGRRVA